MSNPLVQVEQRRGYAVLRLQRPERRNAMSFALQDALLAALDATRDESRATVIAAEGGTFCAGIDLHERASGARNGDGLLVTDAWVRTNERIRSHDSVTIAAVQGHALGGGLTLVNSCDLAIASTGAVFGMPEMKDIGVFPSMAGPTTCWRINPRQAAYLILTSRRIDADTALRWGLVNDVVPPDRLLGAAIELAQEMAAMDREAVRLAKLALLDMPAGQQDWGAAMRSGQAINEELARRRGGISG